VLSTRTEDLDITFTAPHSSPTLRRHGARVACCCLFFSPGSRLPFWASNGPTTFPAASTSNPICASTTLNENFVANLGVQLVPGVILLAALPLPLPFTLM